MTYSFMTIDKIHSEGQLTSKYIHNCRKIDIANVDESKSHLNEDLVKLPQINGKELNYYEAFQKRINELPYYKNHNIRKNAVKAYEIIFTYTKDESVDVNKWKDKSVQWLKDTFNVAPDGKSNVLHVAFHADETGNVHCHAIVVPIDERGRLNARRFTDGARAMIEHQSTYADYVKELGIERGVAGSGARHQDIRKMYASLNNAIKVPEVKPGESAEEYRERTFEHIQTTQAVSKKKSDDSFRKRLQAEDKKRALEMQAIQAELDKAHGRIDAELQKEIEKLKEYKRQTAAYEDMVKKLTGQLYEEKKELQEQQEIKKKVDFYDNFHNGLEIIKENDEAKAIALQNDVDFVMRAAEQYEERAHLYE